MIAHLRGTLIFKSPGQIVIECAGVGYEAAVSVTTFAALPETGATVALHIYTQVREDQLALFGFLDRQEKALFEKLLTISGIGPRLAITVLSGIAPDRLVAAIRGGDHATLTRVPGIGRKTAERVVLELKDKLEELAAPGAVSTGAPPALGAAGEDALSALVNLGYTRAAAEAGLATVMKRQPEVAGDFEGLFRAALTAMR